MLDPGGQATPAPFDGLDGVRPPHSLPVKMTIPTGLPPIGVHPIRRRPTDEPAVDTLLDVDRDYRAKAEADQLKKIAPERFNPERGVWLCRSSIGGAVAFHGTLLQYRPRA